ncbi:MAG TPA: DUF3579 domain-containing protein [Casimicrobiaceae bacterium]
MPPAPEPTPPTGSLDVVVWGTTTRGKPFRPSDWAERLAGLTSAFGTDQKLVYSPLVCPASVRGAQALIISHTLAQVAPRFYQFLLNFARDNELTLAYVDGAIEDPQRLLPPGMDAGGGEPREPV